ncbi:MAG: hypothetical protein ACYCOO_04715 [Chitinophagaceae bacterium]
MKSLKLHLHPLMTISLLQFQINRVLHCASTFYIEQQLANGWDTLEEAGWSNPGMVEYPVDESVSIREFEEEMAEKFHLSLELSWTPGRPFNNKSIKLFQIFLLGCGSPSEAFLHRKDLGPGYPDEP